MRCRHCDRPLQIFRLNPEKVRVEPYCDHCKIFYETAPDPTERRCHGCGLDFSTIRFAERLGCEFCYDAFRDPLLKMMDKRGPFALFESPPPTEAAMSRHHLFQELIGAVAETHSAHPRGPDPHSAGDEHSTPEEYGVSSAQESLHLPTLPELHPPLRGEVLVRLRVARNLPGLPYLSRLPRPERRLLEDFVLSPGSSVMRFFEERMPALAMRRFRSCWRADDDSFEIRVDDEDHIRLAFFLRLTAAAEDVLVEQIERFEQEVSATVEAFDRHLWFQSRLHFGFLTACPSNAGTGRRLSLRFRRQADQAVWLAEVAALRQGGFLLRGASGEGSSFVESDFATVLLPVKSSGALRRIVRLFLRTVV